MKRFLTAILFILVILPATGDAKIKGLMRAGEQPGKIRIVFESEEDIVKSARVFHSHTLVKIELKSGVDLEKEKLPPSVEVSVKGASIFVTIQDLKKINVFRLSDPDRLVIDAEVEGKARETSPSEQKEQDRSGQEEDNSPGRAKPVLVIDPGHGGYDIGLVGNDFKEKDVTLSIARSLSYAMRQGGGKVALTRSTDKYASISERIRSTYETRPDVFVSIHLSSTPHFTVFYALVAGEGAANNRYSLDMVQASHVDGSEKMARALGKELKSAFKRDVKIRQIALPLLASVDADAVLVELPDGRYLNYDQKRHAIVNALMKGISLYEQ